MNKIVPFFASLALLAAGCASAPQTKVMARFVPERSDDFVWENENTCYRVYGEALEGETLSPGFDVWVKMPGALVADQMYKDELENGKSYHKFWGSGKDCYKVGKSLGCGGSVLLVENRFQFPATNYRSYEILESSPEKISFVLHYPEWQADGVKVSLDKTITVESGSYFCKAEDLYTFEGDYDSLYVAAGVVRHDIEAEFSTSDRFAIWEHASDQSVEPEDGMLGLGLYMPGASAVCLSHGDDHSVCVRKIVSGEPVVYYFGSCWSKAGFPDADSWFDKVKDL